MINESLGLGYLRHDVKQDQLLKILFLNLVNSVHLQGILWVFYGIDLEVFNLNMSEVDVIMAYLHFKDEEIDLGNIQG